MDVCSAGEQCQTIDKTVSMPDSDIKQYLIQIRHVIHVPKAIRCQLGTAPVSDKRR